MPPTLSLRNTPLPMCVLVRNAPSFSPSLALCCQCGRAREGGGGWGTQLEVVDSSINLNRHRRRNGRTTAREQRDQKQTWEEIAAYSKRRSRRKQFSLILEGKREISPLATHTKTDYENKWRYGFYSLRNLAISGGGLGFRVFGRA